MNIPRDIESTVQWRVRYESPARPDVEVIREDNEARVRKLAEMHAERNAIVETRTITVSEWGEPEEEPADEADE